MNEVVAFRQDWFALVTGEGVAEAVAEVEVGGMATAAAIVAIGLAGDAGLLIRERFHCDFESFQQLFEIPAQSRTLPAVDHNGNLKV